MIVIILCGYFISVVLLVVLIATAPTIEAEHTQKPDREGVERMHEIMERARWHREQLARPDIPIAKYYYHCEQLEAEAFEFLAWHECELDSPEGDRWEGVIWQGVDYADAMLSVMRLELEE